MVKAGAGYILKVALELLAELSKLSRCAPVRVPWLRACQSHRGICCEANAKKGGTTGIVSSQAMLWTAFFSRKGGVFQYFGSLEQYEGGH